MIPLNRLLISIREYFSARYSQEYSDKKIEAARDYLPGSKFDVINKPHFLPFPCVYGARMDSHKKPKLVRRGTQRAHLGRKIGH